MIASETPTVGDRIRLLEMPDDPDPIPRGALGTVVRVVPSQIGVAWDSGRTLNLVPEMDRWEIVALRCPQCGSRDVKDISSHPGIQTIDCEAGHRTDLSLD